MYDGMRLIRKENGEIQFTETGLSGIAVMQLSNRMKERKPYQIRLNLFPQLSSSQLTDMLYGSSVNLPTPSWRIFSRDY